MQSKEMYGRRKITTDVTELNDNNILRELEKAYNTHLQNRGEIDYLWGYYRGKQPILSRTKEIRPEICNKVVENRANEIVSFKVGYLCGEPIQYIGRNSDEYVTKGIAQLNEMLFSDNKSAKDKEIVEWQMICGTAFRLILPNARLDEDDAPFEIETLDPRDTFVIYSNEIGNLPIAGVKYYTDEFGNPVFSIYSDNHFWKIKSGKILVSRPHSLGILPIFEYPANSARLGSFEIVLPLLDSINTVASNRLDGIEQFVQAYWKFVGCSIDSEQFEEFKERGAILVPPNDTGGNIDVDLIVKELNQVQVQTLVDYMYQTVLTICGIPNRNGGSSTSDTGSAVVLRDGWSLAEARAKDSELVFKQAEKNAIKLMLRICKDTIGTPKELNQLRLKDIDLQFTRRNYENVQSKAQVLTTMLSQSKIHPRLAFTSCGLFSDPEQAYGESMEYYKEVDSKEAMIGGGDATLNNAQTIID